MFLRQRYACQANNMRVECSLINRNDFWPVMANIRVSTGHFYGYNGHLLLFMTPLLGRQGLFDTLEDIGHSIN